MPPVSKRKVFVVCTALFFFSPPFTAAFAPDAEGRVGGGSKNKKACLRAHNIMSALNLPIVVRQALTIDVDPAAERVSGCVACFFSLVF